MPTYSFRVYHKSETVSGNQHNSGNRHFSETCKKSFDIRFKFLLADSDINKLFGCLAGAFPAINKRELIVKFARLL